MLAAPLALAACMDDGAVRDDFPPLSYEFLTPLRLNVAEVEVRDESPPVRGEPSASAPVPPAVALRQMATDRIKAGGSSGRAVFVIHDAAIETVSGGVAGSMAVELDIVLADGTRAGFAEARVERRRSGVRHATPQSTRSELYELVRQMMDDMNVELEFQVRRSLRDWLQVPTTAPAPAAVEQQDLAPPVSGRPAP